MEPEFPIPPKSKNHQNFLPIGLLKLAAYYREHEHKVKLIRGNKIIEEIEEYGERFIPDKIMVTSLFTYWADYVKETVLHYRKLFPDAKIIVGGIYASLMPEHCKRYTDCDEVKEGIVKEAEECFPAYDLIKDTNPHPIDYQIIHASRGCIRDCDFCGVRKIEHDFKPKSSIKGKINEKRKIVFYDNNFLASPYIEKILQELIELKKKKEILWCESQSGFDGRVLKEKPYLGEMLKRAGFRYPRIAWDWGYNQFKEIKEQVNILVAGGYNFKDIYIFVLYNWEIPFEEMERKRIKCLEWNVQIADCRYRPLDKISDKYNPRKEQTDKDYHIHTEAGWTDALIKQFRKNVRRQNICVRHGFQYYSKDFERKRVEKEVMKRVKHMATKEEKIKYLQQIKVDYWFPDEITYPDSQRL